MPRHKRVDVAASPPPEPEDSLDRALNALVSIVKLLERIAITQERAHPDMRFGEDRTLPDKPRPGPRGFGDAGTGTSKRTG